MLRPRLLTLLTGILLSFAGSLNAQTPVWVDVQKEDGVAYLLRKSPAQIMRYDLDAAEWLDPVSLTDVPSAFLVDGSHFFIASGRKLERFNLDGSGKVHVGNTPDDIRGLLKDGNILFVNRSDGSYARFTSFNKSALTHIADFENYIDSLGGASIAPSLNKMFGTRTGGSPRDIDFVIYEDDGTFVRGGDGPYHGRYPIGARTWVFPDDSKVADSSGIIYNTSDLTYNNSFGGGFTDLAFHGIDIPIVLREDEIVSFSNTILETGRHTLGRPAQGLIVHGNTVFAFQENADAPTKVSVETADISDLGALDPGEPISPEGLVYTVEDSAVSADGILYLLSKSFNSLFRWDIQEQQYLETIPLPEAANLVVYSEVLDRLYVYAPSQKLYRIDLADDSPTAVHHLTVPLNINKMIPLGSDLMAMINGSWEDQWIYDAEGALLKANVSCCYDKFHFYDEDAGYLFYDSYKLAYLGEGNFGPREGGYVSSFSPIALSENGQLMIDAAGRIYSTADTTQIDSLSNNVTKAVWNSGNTLFTFKSSVSTDTTTLQKWDEYYVNEGERSISGKPIGLYSHGEKVVVITEVDGTPLFTLLDTDLTVVPPSSLAIPALEISKFSATAATLVWNRIFGAETYVLERKLSTDAAWVEIGTASAEDTSFTDVTLLSGVAYHFRMKAANGALESEYSDVVELDLTGIVDDRADPREEKFIPDDLVISEDDILYFLSRTHESIFAWDSIAQDWAPTIPLEGAPLFFTYSAENNALYTLYSDGTLNSIGLKAENPVEIAFAQMTRGRMCGLIAAGEFIIACDASSNWEDHTSFDAAGNIIDSKGIRYPINGGVWNSVRRNIYHLRDGTSPNDIIASGVLANGMLGTYKDSPYHSSVGIQHPVRVKPDGTIVILGSGRIYDAISLEQVGALSNAIEDAAWNDGALVTLANSVIYSHSSTTYGAQAEVNLIHTGLRLLPTSDGRLIAISRNESGETFIDVYDDEFLISPPAVLAQPAGLSASIAAANSVTISWRDIVGENGYRIERKSDGSESWEITGATGASITSFQDNAVVIGATYQYRVVAVNGDLESEVSEALTVILSAPDAPQNFVATALDGFRIQLDWEKSGRANGYSLERRLVGSSTWSSSQALVSDVFSFVVTGLNPDSEYEFRLRAFNALGNSDWASASAKTEQVPPGTPYLHYPQGTPVSVSLAWSLGSYAQATVVERLLNGSDEWKELAVLPAPASTFVDTDVLPSTGYTYRIKAMNGAGDSAYSFSRGLTTPALPPPPMPLLAAPYPESATSLLISWLETDFADGYRLDYRQYGSNQWIRLGEFGPEVTSYLQTELETGLTYEYRLSAWNAVGTSPYALVYGRPLQLMALLWDDFQPEENYRMWYRIAGGRALDGGQGFDTGAALWFESGSTQVAETMAVDLRQGGYLHFSLRAGNEAEDGDTHWRNATAPRNLALEYSTDGMTWTILENISLTFPNAKEWKRFTVALPVAARSPVTRFRWSAQSTSALGHWAIDNIELLAPEPAQVPWVDYVQASVLNSTTVHLSWPVPKPAGLSMAINPDGVYIFQVERRVGTGFWQTVGLVEGTFFPAYLDYEAPSNENIFYRVRTLAPWDESLPSLMSMVTTLSQLDEWRLVNFGTSENVGPYADMAVDRDGIANIQRYAFGFEAGEIPREFEPGTGAAGMPAVWLDRTTNRLNVAFMGRISSTNPEIQYIVEFSDDLIHWLPQTSPVESTYTRGNWEEVRFEQPPVSYLEERCFVRVRIVRP